MVAFLSQCHVPQGIIPMGVESGAHQNRSGGKERDSWKNDLFKNPLVVAIIRPCRQRNVEDPLPVGPLPVVPSRPGPGIERMAMGADKQKIFRSGKLSENLFGSVSVMHVEVEDGETFRRISRSPEGAQDG